MRKTFIDLVEAVRGLRLSRSRGSDDRVTLGIEPAQLPRQLVAIHRALEAFDADGGVSLDDQTADAGKLRQALDATFRWIRTQGLSTDDPLDLVAEALGSKTDKKKRAAYDILPAFAPQHVRKKSWKPKLSLPIEQLSVMRSIDDHRKVAAGMQEVIMRIGEVAPTEDYAPQVRL